MAFGNSIGFVEVVDIHGQSATIRAKPHGESITALAFTPDGQRLASAARDGVVKVLTADQGEDLLTLRLESGVATQLAWSPDGQRLAAATETGEIQVWDASRGYQFAPDGARRNELAWSYYRRGKGEGLRKFLDLAPDTLTFWRERGHAEAKLGRFDRAALEFAKATRPGLRFAFEDAWYHAYALLGAGEAKSYHKACAALVEAFADSPVPSNQGYVAWLCVLTPNTPIDSAVVLRMAQTCLDANDDGDDHRLTLGACLYRAGQFQRAVEVLQPVATKFDRGGDSTDRYWLACSQYFLALARHRLGHAFQARRYLKEASRQAERVLGSGSTRHGGPWIRGVELTTLRHEASSLIGD